MNANTANAVILRIETLIENMKVKVPFITDDNDGFDVYMSDALDCLEAADDILLEVNSAVH